MDPQTPERIVGIDLGSVTASCAVYTPAKVLVGKPFDFPNQADGFPFLHHKLTRDGTVPAAIAVGLEATGRYWEALYQFLLDHGYQVQLLHPAQTAEFARQRGLRAKTDRIDATTIARVLLSGEAQAVYVPDEQIQTYRELVRLHTNLSDEAARYKLQIRDLVRAVFPEFTQVFADPTGPTAVGLLTTYPGAAAIAAAGVDAIATKLAALAPRRYGRDTAQRLIELAQGTTARAIAQAGRATSLRILCDQLAHTQTNLAQLEATLGQLLTDDTGAGGLRSVPEFGTKTQAVLRAELGDVTRFERSDQVVAYAGLDITVRQSGKWRGQRKLSKRGSGLLRRTLYLAALACLRRKHSAFKEYYAALAARGLSGQKALVAVMRKMLLVAYRLLKDGGVYDPAKVGAAPPPALTPQEARAAA
jgi:transposase